MKRLLIASRYLINIAVITALAGAFVIIIDGVFTTIGLILDVFREPEFSVEGTKALSIGFIEVIDLLFIGIVFYIFALGLYRLFIDSSMNLPRWLMFEEFEELKVILLSVVIVILTINFAGAVVQWDGQTNIMQLGIGIALVIAAIALILYVRTVAKSRRLASLKSNREEIDD